MRRVLSILIGITAILTAVIINNTSARKFDQIQGIPSQDTIESVIDIPINNKAHELASKEFTTPMTRTISTSSVSQSNVETLHTHIRRVFNISSHCHNIVLKTKPHYFLSYGVLLV